MSEQTRSSIGETRPDMLSEKVQRAVLGLMPFSFAEGNVVWKGTFSFQDGDLLIALLDVLVHQTNEFTVNDRRIVLEKGQELWIVHRRAEKDVTRMERHEKSPNASVHRRAAVCASGAIVGWAS